MALEQLSAGDGGDGCVTVAVEGRLDGGDEGARAPRLPRWTRQEILVLIQGKRVAEGRVRRGRTAAMGPAQVEPKWASVSSYCKLHGVNRGPVQCRKRWSNLAGDFKKIKEWESESDSESSFWAMRNDVRRERKLPGFFDREVYDILDGAPAPPKEEIDSEPVFDSGRTAAAEDGLFSDREATPDKEATPVASISEKQYQPIPISIPISIPRPSQAQSGPRPSPPDQGTSTDKQPASAPELGSASRDGRKRKRTATEGDEEHEPRSLESQMIDIMERNGKMLSAQLEAQNTNTEMEREQRREHAESLVAVLNKLADALGRIADRL